MDSYVTDLKERQRRLTFEGGLDNEVPKFLKANQTLADNPIQFVLEGHKVPEDYQVYAYGELLGRDEDLGEAIKLAKQHTGVVVDAHQSIIWEMSNRDLNYFISPDNQVIPALLENLDKGMLPMEAAEAVPNVVCENLTGCDAEDLLYILNQDIPVIAMTSTKKAVVLVGYNEVDVFYKIPGDDGRKSVSYKKMDEMTKKSGHTYIGVKQEK